jgi:hypothetical protein
MSVNLTTANLLLELISLMSKNYLLYETYQERWREYDHMLEEDIKKMKDYSDNFHKMTEQQFELTSGTFVLMEHAIDKLNVMDLELNNMKVIVVI